MLVLYPYLRTCCVASSLLSTWFLSACSLRSQSFVLCVRPSRANFTKYSHVVMWYAMCFGISVAWTSLNFDEGLARYQTAWRKWTAGTEMGSVMIQFCVHWQCVSQWIPYPRFSILILCFLLLTFFCVRIRLHPSDWTEPLHLCKAEGEKLLLKILEEVPRGLSAVLWGLGRAFRLERPFKIGPKKHPCAAPRSISAHSGCVWSVREWFTFRGAIIKQFAVLDASLDPFVETCHCMSLYVTFRFHRFPSYF